MNRCRHILPALVIAASAALLSGCSGSDAPPSGAEPPKTAAATQAPEFTLPDLDGKPRRIGDWKGQVVLLNFWAPWCPPCRREIPGFIKLQDKYGAQGFTVVGIAVDSRDNAQDYVDTNDVHYPILVGEEQGITIAESYGNKIGVLPYSVVIDRAGRIVYTHRGELSYAEAEGAVKPLL